MSLSAGEWNNLLIAHAAATWVLVGLIWTIQLVHYPSFDGVDANRYEEFQQRHMRAMGQLVGLPWLIEGLAVLAVFAFAPDTTSRVLGAVGGLLEVVVIAVTIGLSIPAHNVLSRGYDLSAHEHLVRTNWLRTAAWTARGFVATALLVIS